MENDALTQQLVISYLQSKGYVRTLATFNDEVRGLSGGSGAPLLSSAATAAMVLAAAAPSAAAATMLPSAPATAEPSSSSSSGEISLDFGCVKVDEAGHLICPVPGCGKTFTFRSNLKRHFLTTHVGTRQHICAECGKSFTRSDDLLHHQRQQHGHASGTAAASAAPPATVPAPVPAPALSGNKRGRREISSEDAASTRPGDVAASVAAPAMLAAAAAVTATTTADESASVSEPKRRRRGGGGVSPAPTAATAAAVNAVEVTSTGQSSRMSEASLESATTQTGSSGRSRAGTRGSSRNSAARTGRSSALTQLLCPAGCGESFIQAEEAHLHLRQVHPDLKLEITPHVLPELLPAEEFEEGGTSAEDSDSQHRHDVGCGHPPVLRDGRLHFLLKDGLLAVPGGAAPPMPMPVDLAHPAHCNTHVCQTHDASHKHSKDCGHPMVRHGDHYDFLVDGHLHHFHPVSPLIDDHDHSHDHSHGHTGGGSGGKGSSSEHDFHCDDHGPVRLLDDDSLAFLNVLNGMEGAGSSATVANGSGDGSGGGGGGGAAVAAPLATSTVRQDVHRPMGVRLAAQLGGSGGSRSSSAMGSAREWSSSPFK